MNMQFSYTIFIESKDLRSLNIFEVKGTSDLFIERGCTVFLKIIYRRYGIFRYNTVMVGKYCKVLKTMAQMAECFLLKNHSTLLLNSKY